MGSRILFKVLSVLFAVIMALNAIFPDFSNGFGVFLFIASICLLVVWVFTAIRCFRKEAIPPTDKGFEILALVSFIILLLQFDFANWFGIVTFICEAVAAVFIIVALVRDRKGH